jgi:hypothetical protein
VFSVTVFTELLGNVFQQWTFLSSRTGGHLTPNSTLPTAVSGLFRNGSWSSLYRVGTDRTKTPLPTVTPLLRVIQPLPRNGCFSGSTVLALRKHATILSNIYYKNNWYIYISETYFISMESSQSFREDRRNSNLSHQVSSCQPLYWPAATSDQGWSGWSGWSCVESRGNFVLLMVFDFSLLIFNKC